MKLLLALLLLALQTTETNGMGTKKITGVFGKVKGKFKDKGGGMQIYVKPKLGRRVRLDVEASDMIADIKVQIEDSPSLPPFIRISNVSALLANSCRMGTLFQITTFSMELSCT